MSTIEDRTDTSGTASAGSVDMKVEVITIPVSHVERAQEFYVRAGWRLDVTPPGVVQLTPPGFVVLGPVWRQPHIGRLLGSAQNTFLVVSDLAAARDQLMPTRQRTKNRT